MERYAAIDVALGGSSACVVDAEDDRRHGRCLAAFSASAVLLATSAAVLAEMLHLVGVATIAAPEFGRPYAPAASRWRRSTMATWPLCRP